MTRIETLAVGILAEAERLLCHHRWPGDERCEAMYFEKPLQTSPLELYVYQRSTDSLRPATMLATFYPNAFTLYGALATGGATVYRHTPGITREEYKLAYQRAWVATRLAWPVRDSRPGTKPPYHVTLFTPDLAPADEIPDHHRLPWFRHHPQRQQAAIELCKAAPRYVPTATDALREYLELRDKVLGKVELPRAFLRRTTRPLP